MEDYRSTLLGEHFTEPTRKARRNLLLSSGISLVLIKGQLVPTNISALGISIDKIQRETIFQALLVLVVYYFIKFYVYSIIDGHNQSYLNKKAFLGEDLPTKFGEIQKLYTLRSRGQHKEIGTRLLIWVIIRLSMDYIVPIIVGGYTLYHLLKAFVF